MSHKLYVLCIVLVLLVSMALISLPIEAAPASAASCGMHIYILSHNNLTLNVSLAGGGGYLDWGDGSGINMGEGIGQKIWHGYAYNVGGTISYTVTLSPDGGAPCHLVITIDDNNVPTFCNLYGVEVGFNALTVGADVQVGNAQSARIEWGDGSYVDIGNGSGQHQWHSYSYNSAGQDVYTITLSIPHAAPCVRTFTIDGPSQQGWLSGGDAVSSYYPCPLGIGPGGITPGNHNPSNLSQEQRQYLYEAFGNSGQAPVGYGGQGCSGDQGFVTPPTPPAAPTAIPATSIPPTSTPQQTTVIIPISSFGVTYSYEVFVDGSTCYIVNGSTIVAQEISRFQSVLTSIPQGSQRWEYAIHYMAPDDVDFLFRAEIDHFRILVENMLQVQTGCAQKRYYIGSLSMDMSGLGNIMFGYYMAWADEDTEARIANADQWFSDFSSAALQLQWQWTTEDYPDDIVQRRIGRRVSELTASSASPSPSLIEQVSQELGLF